MKESRKRKALEEMDVMDNFMITELASHPTEGKKFTRTLLSVLLQRKIGDITVHAQSVFQGDTPELRGIRLDVEITEKIDRSPEEGESAYVIFISSFDPFGYNYMMYTIHNKCVELPELEYKDGLKYIYFYTKGKKGGSKEISTLLSYLQHSIIENVKDEATQSIHDSVEKIKHSAEVRGKYMTIGEIMDYHKAVGYAEGRAEGRQDGRAGGICETLRLLNWSDEEIMQKLMDMCGISREEALKYMEQK